MTKTKHTMKNKKITMSKHKFLSLFKLYSPLCFILIILSGVIFVLYTMDVTHAVNQVQFVGGTMQNEETGRFKLSKGDIIRQELTVPELTMGFAFDLIIDNPHNEDNTTILSQNDLFIKLSLIDPLTQDIIASETFPFNLEADVQQFGFTDAPVLIPNHSYILQLENTSSEGVAYNIISRLDSDIPAMSIGDELVPGVLSFSNIIIVRNQFIQNLYLIFTLFMLFTLTGMYILLFVYKKIKLETAYLISILLIGFLYVFMIRPNGSPDELIHYDATHNRLYQILHITDFDPLDGRDVILPSSGIHAFQNLYQGFTGTFPELSNQQYRQHDIGTPDFSYITPMIGLGLGRLLSLNNVITFYLGRIFNLLMYALVTFYAMKRIPFGKMTIAALSFFPMVMNLSASFSYDTIINATAILFTAIAIDLIYSKARIEVKDYIILIVIGIILFTSKNGVYYPLMLLLLTIPRLKFRGIRKKTIVLIGLNTVWMFSLLYNMLSNITASISSEHIEWVNYQSFTIGWMLSHPIRTMDILVYSFWSMLDTWFFGILGSNISWHNLPNFMLFTIVFMIVFLVTLVPIKDEVLYVISDRMKSLCVLILFLSCGMIFAGMWLSWTPMFSRIILGIQGRYFIPLIPVLILLARSGIFKLQRNVNFNLLYTIIFVQTLSLLQFFIFQLNN